MSELDGPVPPEAPPTQGEPPPAAAEATPQAPGSEPPPAEAAPVPVPAPPAPEPEGPVDPVAELRARGRHVEIACVLAFLVPGLGHLYLGKRAKGLVSLLLVCGLYATGLVLSKGEAVSIDREYGHPYAFWAQVGAGLPTGLALARTHESDVRRALGLEAQPRETPSSSDYQSPAFIAELPRQDEGLLYTMIAGLLNLLLVHDAYSGSPGSRAREDEDDDEDDEPDASAEAARG